MKIINQAYLSPEFLSECNEIMSCGSCVILHSILNGGSAQCYDNVKKSRFLNELVKDE